VVTKILDAIGSRIPKVPNTDLDVDEGDRLSSECLYPGDDVNHRDAVLFLALFVYVVARVLAVLEAFISLRRLPRKLKSRGMFP
jgi:hypothetical protein